ncbi:MAG: hypothetical protein DRQ39_11335 [Gammaproteobacteria bacterium]|nr:MAG: hypothetical protein DRQ39_11335 [Gammaproteobacteria bacterium]
MSTLANPLPPDKVEGDSGDTDVWDDNDTPPGHDRDNIPVDDDFIKDLVAGQRKAAGIPDGD